MERLYFAGHETFHCRNYWLKKGLDHLWNGNAFDDTAIIGLGVGKNMVTSVKFWLKAFNLTDESGMPLKLAELLFDEQNGYDPYCEDIATIWLLHHNLVTKKRASIYHIVFNKFRKERTEFTKEQLGDYLEKGFPIKMFETKNGKKEIVNLGVKNQNSQNQILPYD